MKLEDLQVYRLSMDIGEKVWEIVEKWNYFSKDIPIFIGRKQLVRAADSVSANLSEGFGRFHFKENKHFAYYARGSLYETKTWLIKAHDRKLISDDDFQLFQTDINSIGVKLNNYINSLGKQKGTC